MAWEGAEKVVVRRRQPVGDWHSLVAGGMLSPACSDEEWAGYPIRLGGRLPPSLIF